MSEKSELQVVLNKQQHYLACWTNEEEKTRFSFDADSPESDCFLLLGQARISNGAAISLSAQTIWSRILDLAESDAVTGRFSAIKFSGGVVSVAADINATLSTYWAVIDGRFVATTDFWFLVSLLPDRERSIDLESFYETIALGYCVSESTLLKSIRRVEAGHVLLWNEQTQKHSASPYYLWSYGNLRTSESIAENAVENALRSSVSQLLKNEDNPAILLSGGVDSGMVYAMINRVAGGLVQPYTVKFAGSKYDETAAAREIANLYSNDLQTIQINYNDMFDGAVDSARASYEPAYNQNMNLEFAVQKLIASNGHTSVWDGDFADALFGPMSIHNFSNFRKMKVLPHWLVDKLLRFVGKFDLPQFSSHTSLWEKFGEISLRQYTQQSGSALQYTPASLGMDFSYQAQSRDRFYSEIKNSNQYDKFMICSYYLADRVFNAKNEMFERAVGLTPKKPFIQTGVMQEAGRMPLNYRVRPGVQKYMLKKVAEKYIPKSIIYATKVTYDSVPHARYIREDTRWRDYLDTMLSGRSRVFEILDENLVKKQMEMTGDSGDFDAFLLWRLVTLDIWFNRLDIQGHVAL